MAVVSNKPGSDPVENLPLSVETNVSEDATLEKTSTKVLTGRDETSEARHTLFPLQENMGNGTGIGTLIPI